MPICMGILCEKCERVHLISAPSRPAHILFNRTRGDFKLNCIPPCGAVSFFRKDTLTPYSVSAEALEKGYADIGECPPVKL
jgi:hypothetical protein